MSNFFITLTIFAFTSAMTIMPITCSNKKETSTNNTTNPLTKTQILTAKTWRIDQIHRVINGSYSSYDSNGNNTTGVNFGNNRYTFYADGTAKYTNESSITYNATWQFSSADERSIRFSIIGFPADDWQLVEIAGNYLHGTENFTVRGNTDNMHSFRLIQIP